MVDRTPAPQQGGDAHEDLLATLAAGRELGPEMDQSLAEAYMRKHAQPAPVIPQQRPDLPTRPNPGYAGLAAIGPVVGIVAFIAILVLSGGHLWWMFWLPMALGGWWSRQWGGDPWHAQRDEMRNQRRMARDEMRYDRHMARDQYRAWRRGYGYPPDPYDDPRVPGGYPQYPAPNTDPRAQSGQPPAPSTPPNVPGRDVL